MSNAPEHLSPEALTGFKEHTLDARALLAVDDHLAGCAECRARLLEPGDVAGAQVVLRAPAADHLEHLDLVGYVEGALSAERTLEVRRHLDRCPPCQLAESDLRQTRLELDEAMGESVPAPRSRAVPWLAWLSVPALGLSAAAAVVLFLQVGSLRGRLRQEQARGDRFARAAQAAGDLEKQQQRLEERNRELESQLPASQADAERLRKEKADLESAFKLAQTGRTTVIRDGSGTVLLGPDGGSRVVKAEPLPQLASAALGGGDLALPPGLSALLAPAQVTRGGGGRFAVIGPSGTRIREVRPTLRWEPLAKATRYSVLLTDMSVGSPPVEYEVGKETHWLPPKPLERGHRYSWQVQAFAGEESAGTAPQAPDREARFEVLEAADNALLEAELASRKDSPLGRGLAFASAGLLDDAERELEPLAKANPGAPQLMALLQKLRAARTAGSAAKRDGAEAPRPGGSRP
jgi:hypothetical protein